MISLRLLSRNGRTRDRVARAHAPPANGVFLLDCYLDATNGFRGNSRLVTIKKAQVIRPHRGARADDSVTCASSFVTFDGADLSPRPTACKPRRVGGRVRHGHDNFRASANTNGADFSPDPHGVQALPRGWPCQARP